jgi:TolB-like protein/Tfp pilus assembly protein PilF
VILPMSEASHAVFLSYASQDREAAQKICEALRAAGIEVWFDQSELRGGDAWDRSIRRQIKTCALFLPVISHTTHDRIEGYFRLEWKLGIDRSHLISADQAFLLPVVIDDTRDNDERVPERFREVQWTRLPGGVTLAAFVERVQRLLSGEPAQESTRTASAAAHVPAAPSTREPVVASSWRSKAALLATIAVLVAALGYLVTQSTWVSRVPRVPERSDRVAATASAASLAPVPEKSIAVLPFVDMSEKHDQGYFADGLAEEVLDQLARIGDLHVIARTSSFAFKDKSDDIPTIAKKLRVATILEGSVRKSRSRVRVTTQLVRAETGEHIWSNSYDREFKDILGIQADIAAAVAVALKATLLENFKASTAGTNDIEAFEFYLRARAESRRDVSEAGSKEALALIRRATSIDPNYAAAWALMATIVFNIGAGSGHAAAAVMDAKILARRAITLEPKLIEGHVAYARALVFSLDITAAREQIEEAMKINPNDPWAIAWAAAIARFDGRFDESVRLMQKSVDIDPENFTRFFDLSRSLRAAGRYQDAEIAYQHYTENVHDPNARGYLAVIKLDLGDPAGALRLLDEEDDPKVRASCSCLARALDLLGRRAEADAALKDLETHFAVGHDVPVAKVYAQRGDADRTFHWLDRAVANKDSDILEIRWDRAFDSIRTDNRYLQLLDRLGLPH